MIHVLIRHRVQDFDAWKPLFDDHAEFRRQGGSQGGTILRNLDDPNEVYVLLRWDDIRSASAFLAHPNLQEILAEGGVLDEPEVVFLGDAARPPA